MDAIPAQVTHVMGSMGIRGVVRVRCKIMDGRDKDKSISRSVLGPTKPGDIIMLKEMEMEFGGRDR